MRWLLWWVMFAALGGCSVLPERGAGTTPHHFVLAAPGTEPVTVPDTAPVVVIAAPRAAAGYDTERMAYTRRPYELDYFAYNEWVDAPSRMLAPALAGALEATGRFRTAYAGSGMRGALRLESTLLLLRQEFSGGGSVGRVRLRVRLLEGGSSRLLAMATFDEREPVAGDGPYGGVVAINRALGRVLAGVAALTQKAVGEAGR